MRITTMPLQSKFMAQLDRYSADLTKLFSKRGGAAGKKIRHIMERTAQVYELSAPALAPGPGPRPGSRVLWDSNHKYYLLNCSVMT